MSAPLAWYNEPDKHAAQWLRNLIDAGAIAPGVVDERSIEDVRPDDLTPFRQCHFFAGIGVWSHALRLAGWPDDRPVWTGSCPCQPFSAAGKGLGFTDERHLWPAWFHLIAGRARGTDGDRPSGDGRQPNVLFGEQVASGGSAEWIRLVRSDLEGLGNTVGVLPIEAASAGADHLRDRYWWCAVGDAACERGDGRNDTAGPPVRPGAQDTNSGSVADAPGARSLSGAFTGVHSVQESVRPRNVESERYGWVIGADGKTRRVKPGIRLLAHGTAGRLDFHRPTEPGEPEAPPHTYSHVGALKGFGNAIDPRPAAAWIRTVMEWIDATGGTRY